MNITEVWFAFNSVDDDEPVMFFTELPGEDLKKRFILKRFFMSDNTAANDVLAERQRQKDKEGWSTDHDDQYTDCELARAAATYALCTNPNQLKIQDVVVWPWSQQGWKPASYRRNLVKAAALLLAEIERMDRTSFTGVQKNEH